MGEAEALSLGLNSIARNGKDMPTPSRLYKYEAISSLSLENLKAQAIYFGSPLGFNDPYDCALTPNIRIPSTDEIEKIREDFLVDKTAGEETKKKLREASLESLKDILLESGRINIEEAIYNFLNNRGVACFSERKDDLLMWSHYGGCYKGFCLEFSTALSPFEKMIQVKYRNDLPEIDLVPLLIGQSYEHIQDLFCTKSAAWEYEAEWRCIHEKAGTKYIYSPNCLTGIYFGPDANKESIEIICLILKGQNESIRFWRGKRSTKEFKVVFEEFTYMSYLEAKKKGLRE